MNYKLLVFNEDYADEHDVPALACFTQEEYDAWLESEITKVDPDYETILSKFQENLHKYKLFDKQRQEKGLYGKSIHQLTAEEKEWYEANYVPAVYDWKSPGRGESKLCAWLGNNGECFGRDYIRYTYAKELVEADIVKVYDVDENFYRVFNLARLNSLSLCNVFEIEE